MYMYFNHPFYCLKWIYLVACLFYLPFLQPSSLFLTAFLRGQSSFFPQFLPLSSRKRSPIQPQNLPQMLIFFGRNAQRQSGVKPRFEQVPSNRQDQRPLDLCYRKRPTAGTSTRPWAFLLGPSRSF